MSRLAAPGPTLTLFAEGSLARTSAPPADGEGSGAPAVASGTTSPASSSRSDRASSSSRMSRRARVSGCVQSGISCTCSDTERAPWGLPPRTLAHLTAGGAYSLLPTLTETANLLCPSMQKWPSHRLLPTVTASTYDSNRGGAAGRVGEIRYSLEGMAKRGMLPTLTAAEGTSGPSSTRTWRDGTPARISVLMPTLTASVAARGAAHRGPNAQGGPNLAEVILGAAKPLCPAADEPRGSTSDSASPSATNAAQLLPTLTRRDEKGPGPAHTKAGADLPQSLGGHLSADWCRWFMGFPVGWLDVDDDAVSLPSATPSSRSARKSSGK